VVPDLIRDEAHVLAHVCGFDTGDDLALLAPAVGGILELVEATHLGPPRGAVPIALLLPRLGQRSEPAVDGEAQAPAGQVFEPGKGRLAHQVEAGLGLATAGDLERRVGA